MDVENYEQGFTLLEVSITMAMLTLVGGIALFMSMETYRSSSFRVDRDLLIAALQHARAESVNNICIPPNCSNGQPHGVHIQSDRYVVFQGPVYDPSDGEHNASFVSAITTTKTPTTLDIVFSQLSGTSTPTSIALSDNVGHASVISINSEGRITWTH